MRTCVIVNPVAGGGRVGRRWPTLLPRLREAIPQLTVRTTTSPGHATSLTRTALRRGRERIVAVGGDGTLHEVVNGFFDEEGTPVAPSARLVPLPCGTGMDFWRSLEVDRETDPVALVRSNRVRSIDLLHVAYTTPRGNTAQRYAVNIASVGLSSHVVRFLNRRDSGSFPGSPLRYLKALLHAVVHHRPFALQCILDGTPLGPMSGHLVSVANGRTFGSGICIAPTADLYDGCLDVTILHNVSVWSLLPRLHRFYRGTHLSLAGVSSHRGHRLTIRSPQAEAVWLEADGELLGILPATIEVVPSALRLQY